MKQSGTVVVRYPYSCCRCFITPPESAILRRIMFAYNSYVNFLPPSFMHIQVQYLYVIGAFRHSFLLCPFSPHFIRRLDLSGPSHFHCLWLLPKRRKQRIGSSLTIILQLVLPILIFCCFRSAFAQLVEVGTKDLFCSRMFAPVRLPELPRWLRGLPELPRI